MWVGANAASLSPGLKTGRMDGWRKKKQQEEEEERSERRLTAHCRGLRLCGEAARGASAEGRKKGKGGVGVGGVSIMKVESQLGSVPKDWLHSY